MTVTALAPAPATAPTARIHSRGDRFVVIDDLLDAADFADAAAHFAATTLKPVLSTIDPVYDGFAYRGGSEKQPLDGGDCQGAPRWRTAVKEQVAAHLDVLAADSADGLDVTFSAWGYPAGSRLSWHNDAGAGRIGAYVLFTHREWNASWGGGLAVIDEESRADAADGAALVHSATHPALIQPRPNRLVIFRAHTMHAVQRVDSCAGDRLRQTCTGFISERSERA